MKEERKKNAIIFVVGGTKGGCGKSFVTLQLAIGLAQEGKEVLLVDGDEQETSYKFCIQREKQNIQPTTTCIKLTDKAVRTEVLKLRKNYDFIVIDVGGRDTTSQRAAISVADIFITPVPPVSFDVWETKAVDELIEEMEQVNPDIKAYAILNKADARGRDNQATIDHILTLKKLLYLDAPIVSRKAFSNAAALGMLVNEQKKPNKKAVMELERFHNKIKMISKQS